MKAFSLESSEGGQVKGGLSEILSVPEIVQVMLSLTDLDRLIVLYPSMKSLIDTPSTLEILSRRFILPYKIDDYNGGYVTTKTLIKSLPDLIFSLRLRDPEERKKMCLSRKKMLEIAVQEDDFELLKNLLEEDVSYVIPSPDDSNSSIFHMSGCQGNKSIIDLLLLYGADGLDSVLYGLARNHHNKLLDEYMKSIELGWSPEIYQTLAGAAVGNNSTAFAKYWPRSGVWIGDILYHVGLGNSKKILRFFDKDMIIKSDILLCELLDGYLTGGYLKYAKKIYQRIEQKFLIMGLDHLVEHQSVECFLYAEEIGLISNKISKRLKDLKKLSATAWFIVMRDNSLVNIVFDALLESSEDTNGLIRLYQHFNPTNFGVQYLLKFLRDCHPRNACFHYWLLNHLSDRKYNL